MTARAGDGSGRTRQTGLLLPLLAVGLVLGLAAGTVGLSLWSVTGRSNGSDVGADAIVRLQAARLALLAHATAYPESYGPASAGPGHLVCPDTDTPLDSAGWSAGAGRGDRRDGAAFRGDGPDPPCGNGPLAVGRLPRHVSLADGRRAFHHESDQRFVYGVSTRYVNNPLGRTVNLATGAGTDDEAVAIVIDPRGVALPAASLAGARDPRELLERVRAVVRATSGTRAAHLLPHAFLRRDALIEATARRVAAWFVDTAAAAAARRCDGRGRSHGSALAPGREAFPDESEPCRTRWPDVRCGDPSEPLRWLDERASTACVAGDDPASSVAMPPDAIENTPRERHWFTRNGWARFVRVVRDAGCRGRSADRCRLRVGVSGGEVLLVRLAPGP